MSLACAHCGSTDTAALLNNNQCYACGQLTDFENNKVEGGMDDTTREAFESRMAPREPSIVGNLADLQRAGGLIATGQATNFREGVEEITPVDKVKLEVAQDAKAEADKEAKAEAKADAKLAKAGK